jgi:hypothetical protein
MDPLNKLPHSLVAVNTVKTRLVYLAYDVAPNYVVVWFCKENIKQKSIVFERRILRRIFGPTQKADGEWRFKTN